MKKLLVFVLLFCGTVSMSFAQELIFDFEPFEKDVADKVKELLPDVGGSMILNMTNRELELQKGSPKIPLRRIFHLKNEYESHSVHTFDILYKGEKLSCGLHTILTNADGVIVAKVMFFDYTNLELSILNCHVYAG